MHLIVQKFTETDDNIQKIIEEYYNPEQLLECTLLKLHQLGSIEKVNNQIYLDLDHSILKGHPDINLYLFFLASGVLFTSNRKQLDRARIMCSIGMPLLSDKIVTDVKVYFLQAIAGLKSSENKILEANELKNQVLSMLNKKSPRYISFLGSIITVLAAQGKLYEISSQDIELMESQNDSDRKLNYLISKLKNCIFTGNFEEGFVLIKEYAKLFKGDATYLIQDRLNLLKMVSGDLNIEHYEGDFFKQFINACFLLSEGEINKAQLVYNKIENKKWDRVPTIPFYKYLPLHIELSLKNKGKARLLIKEGEFLNEDNYINDFFLMRLYLLESNINEAHASYYRLIENINRYGAMNRLLFEMQFAKELSAMNIMKLSNGMKNEIHVNSAVVKNLESTGLFNLENKTKLLIGKSKELIQLKKIIKKFALLKEPVLITGETGTGKELVSLAIHEEGLNATKPFLAINCGALSESLLESELFGYEAGAFTGALKERKGIFEAAGDGTVFLDEFGDISSKMQVALLRVLESNEIRLIGGTKSRQVNCKIIIATNIDLQKAVDEGKFRKDLFFRLNRFDINLPALRDRKEDIPLLIDYFLNSDENSEPKRVSPELLKLLVSYSWPGNIRELRNEIERLKILHADKKIIDIKDFDLNRLQNTVKNSTKQNKNLKITFQNESDTNTRNQDVSDERIVNIMNQISNAKQRQLFIKKLFQKYKNISRAQIMKIVEISQSTATKDLKELCNEGFIIKIMPSKSVRTHFFKIVD